MKEQIEKLKSFYNNNKQKVNFFGSAALIMLIIIIVIAIAVKFVGTNMSYEKLEEILEQATVKYLEENPDIRPTSTNPTIAVSTNTLIENKYIKDLKKYVKDSSCTADILVDYVIENDYKYQAYLTCNNFHTEKFMDTIKNNNKISQVGEGLYEMNNELVFRGQNPNNYISFANELWRIVKIDRNNNIHIILTETEDDNIYGTWDDRYNSEMESNYGINNYALSRALITTKDLFQKKYLENKEYLSKFDLCIGKRGEASTNRDGSLECNEIIKDQDIGLLPIYDFMNASLDALCSTSLSRECQNYNYLTDNDYKWWTMTADMKDTYSAYSVSYSGEVYSEYTSGNSILRYVIALSSDVLYKSGVGTKEDPYIVR